MAERMARLRLTAARGRVSGVAGPVERLEGMISCIGGPTGRERRVQRTLAQLGRVPAMAGLAGKEGELAGRTDGARVAASWDNVRISQRCAT